jgi:plasmid maintenance system killer protein
MMGIRSFKSRMTEDINYGRVSKKELRVFTEELHWKAQVKLARVGAATSLQVFREIMGNHFEILEGDRKNNRAFE